MSSTKENRKNDREIAEIFPCYTPMKAPADLSAKQQLEMFHKIVLIREFETRVKELWMQNKIYGLAHTYVGAEAIAVGACTALRPDDCISSTHRGHGHTIAKGGNIRTMMAELFGKYEGYNHGKGGSMHIADVENGMLGATGIVGSGMPLAVGAAMANDMLNNGKVVICFHGDGGTSQGVWHESMNMAAAWNLPVIFLTENNQWAVATPVERVVKELDIYKRAQGYGIPGVRVDGFNPFAVYEATKEAVERARGGEGPTLIEAYFVRLIGHFVADDQWYRDLDPVKEFWKIEPVPRMREYLLENKIATQTKLKEIEKGVVEEVEEAIRYADTECHEPDANTLYEDIYAAGEIIK
jgi:pyruvate dehydrogenase E1 component alpha subunit